MKVDTIITIANLVENERVGRCYELAGRYVSDHSEAVLVHGQLVNPFGKGLKQLDHAWVEVDGKIFDPVMNQTWPTETYVGFFKAVVHRRYNHKQVLEKTLEHETWGPWE